MLGLVKELLGVVPNAAPILEIWPTGFRTYNLLVPNLLNLPNTLWDTPLKQAIGIAMYASSKAANSSYCTAQSCAFTLKRGAEQRSIQGELGPKMAVVSSFAQSLAQLPCTLSKQECEKMRYYFSEAEIEQIVLSIGLMGFLNKFMDAVGVELEETTIANTAKLLAQTGWTPGAHANGNYKIPKTFGKFSTDGPMMYLRVVRLTPGANKLEKPWIEGVPSSYPKAGEYLESWTGFYFPGIKHIKQKKAVRALVAVLRDNLDPATTQIGLSTKCLAGMLYADIVQNSALMKEGQILTKYYNSDLNNKTFKQLKKLAHSAPIQDANTCKDLIIQLSKSPDLSKKDAAVMLLTKAASSSPAQINEVILEEVVPLLSAAELTELMVWLSIQQMLHRLYAYYAIYRYYEK